MTPAAPNPAKTADSGGTSTLWRLRAVYCLMGMMLFYGVEQLFLNKYLHNASARGYVTIVFIASLVVFDVPAGILADRAGRKPCLMWACVAQIAGLMVLGASNALWMYLVGMVLFGLYFGLFNGAAQAFLYDWLASRKQAKQYARQQGTMYAWWLSGAGIANILSGFTAHALGLRSVFFLSAVPGVVAFGLLYWLAEPPLVKKQAAAWYSHIGEAYREVRANRRIISFALQFVAATVVLMTIGEFGQIYILSFGVSTVMLGIYWAITAAFAAGGRGLAHRLQARPRLAVGLFCLAVAAFSLVDKAIGIGLFWLMYGLNEMLSNIAETEIQDATSSHIRATMISLVSFAGNILAIPVVLGYTVYYRHHGIIAANRIVAFAVIIVLGLTLLARPSKHRAGSVVASPQPETTVV